MSKKPSPARAAATMHNWSIGQAVMLRSVAFRIHQLPTASAEARAIAVRIEQDAEFLEQALRAERIDPK